MIMLHRNKHISMDKWPILSLRQGDDKMNLKHLVVPESKELKHEDITKVSRSQCERLILAKADTMWLST